MCTLGCVHVSCVDERVCVHCSVFMHRVWMSVCVHCGVFMCLVWMSVCVCVHCSVFMCRVWMSVCVHCGVFMCRVWMSVCTLRCVYVSCVDECVCIAVCSRVLCG